jgi:replication initiation protein RepC
MGPALLQAIEDLVVRMTPLPAALSASATDANPNGKRYSKRDGKGRIVEAYGFDLSPLAARYAEFVRLAEEGRAEREAMGRLRRRGTIARKGIRPDPRDGARLRFDWRGLGSPGERR